MQYKHTQKHKGIMSFMKKTAGFKFQIYFN